MSPTKNPALDAYIAAAAPFAQPILRHCRKLFHRGCPCLVETIKWGHPSFTLDGKILCYLAAFKAHAAVGFWGPAMHALLKKDRGSIEGAFGAMGRVTSRADLPDDATMLRYVKTAAEFLAAGRSKMVRRAKPKPALPSPADLVTALAGNAAAAGAWKKFSPAMRRDYIEWITEAKRAETRTTRIATTVAWVAEGKKRNWKYEEC